MVASAVANYWLTMLNLKPVAAEIAAEMVAHQVNRAVASVAAQRPQLVAALDPHCLTDYSPGERLDDFVPLQETLILSPMSQLARVWAS